MCGGDGPRPVTAAMIEPSTRMMSNGKHCLGATESREGIPFLDKGETSSRNPNFFFTSAVPIGSGALNTAKCQEKAASSKLGDFCVAVDGGLCDSIVEVRRMLRTKAIGVFSEPWSSITQRRGMHGDNGSNIGCAGTIN